MRTVIVLVGVGLGSWTATSTLAPSVSESATCGATCEQFVPFGTPWFSHTIPNVGAGRFYMRAPHTAVDPPPYGSVEYYVNGSGISDPAPFPDGQLWVGEGQYQCSCGCLAGLPTLLGIKAHPNQFTVFPERAKPPEDEQDRDDYEGSCLQPPCEGAGGSGGGTGGGTSSYLDSVDYPTGENQGAMEIHTVCEVVDWYVDGTYTNTQVVSCWYELHAPHG